jgi:hypothetical protein
MHHTERHTLSRQFWRDADCTPSQFHANGVCVAAPAGGGSGCIPTVDQMLDAEYDEAVAALTAPVAPRAALLSRLVTPAQWLGGAALVVYFGWVCYTLGLSDGVGRGLWLCGVR